MNMKRATTVLVLALAIAVPSVSAQGIFYSIFHPDEVGAGFTVTHQSRLGPVTAGGPGIEFMASYRLSNNFFINAGTGLYTITDELLTSSVTSATLLPILDIRLGYRLLPDKKFSPYLLTGLTAFGLKSSQAIGGGVPVVQGPFFDGGAIIGLGFEYRLNHQWTLLASGEYRYIFTASGNLLAGDNTIPQHYVAKAGVSYSLNPRLLAAREEIEYPLGESELVLDDLFREEPSRIGKRESASEEEDALAMLFRPESEHSSYKESTAAVQYPDTEVGLLMRKVDEMKDLIRERNETIQNLKDQVRANEKAIAEISRGSADLAAGSFGVSDPKGFKERYESALQLFYKKNYQQSISIFQNLLSTNPDHRLASNCQYWIGECYYAMRDYRRAINAFQEVLNFRRSYKFDDALIMSGLSYMRLGNSIMARENFQQLISRFPESEYTPKAMRYLSQL